MPKHKDFETLNYMRGVVKSWTEKADSPAIADNTGFLTGRQCAATAKAAIDVMEANETQRGDVVAFTGFDILTKIPVLMGVFFNGCTSSALAPFTSTPSRRHMLNESGAKLFSVDRTTQHTAEEMMTGECSCPIIEEESFTDLTVKIGPEELLIHADRNKAGDWNTLRYASGSIGTPKGMLLIHRSTELMTYNYTNHINGVGLESRFLCTMSLSSLEGCGMVQMFATPGLVSYIYRGCVAPVGILSEMGHHRITALFLPSSRMTAVVYGPSFEMTDLSALKSIVYAGQTINPTNLNEATEAIGGDRLLQAYDQTEAGMLSVPDQVDHCSGDPEILSSAGRLFFSEDIEIRDDGGNMVPEGTSDEIFIRGDHINSARWTPERSRVSTMQPDGRVATTDMARWIGDRVQTTGRKRDTVLCRGYSVSIRPIEETLQRYEGAPDAVVHPTEDSYIGEVVLAWLRLNEDATVDKKAVSGFIWASVSKWSRPSYIEFVDMLPQASVLKKVDKASLRR